MTFQNLENGQKLVAKKLHTSKLFFMCLKQVKIKEKEKNVTKGVIEQNDPKVILITRNYIE